MTINAIDIRKDSLLEYEGRVCQVLKTMHTQPGKGGAYMQVEMKDIKSGKKNNVRFRSSESVTEVILNCRQHVCLFKDDTNKTFDVMDSETYEQLSIPYSVLGDSINFLQADAEIMVKFYGDDVIEVELPTTMIFKVEECEPVVKGQTATSSYKPAKLDNGIKITVPQFINVGDEVVVKTATHEYVERAK